MPRSIATARCNWLTRIGDLPGCTTCRRCAGNRHSADRRCRRTPPPCFTPGGGVTAAERFSGRARLSASAMRKNSGAAASTPMKRGIALPCEVADPDDEHVRPDDRRRTRRREIPTTVPVFQATGQRARAGNVPSSSGRGLWRSISSVMKPPPRSAAERLRSCGARPIDAQRPQHALVRQHRVQPREFFHRHFAAAERKRQTVERLRTQSARHRRSAGTDTGSAASIASRPTPPERCGCGSARPRR